MARPSYDDGDTQAPMRSAFPAPPPAVKRLMIVNALVFAACVLLYVASNGSYEWVARAFGLTTEMWRDWAPWVPLWQLASYGFLHSVGDPWHIVMNMLTLYFFGSMLERGLGAQRFLITYFASQVLGGVFFLVLSLAMGSSNLLIGASGGCFGVMVAAATLWPRTPVILIFIPMTLRTMALIFVGIELYQFLLATALGAAADSRISHITHLGGIVYGFIAVRTGLVHWDPVRAVAKRRVEKAVESAAEDERRMDQLLEKIHREGMSSLSRGERDFLKRVSSRR